MSQGVLETNASMMVITWPEDLLERIKNMAQRRGIKAEELVVETMHRHLQTLTTEASPARQELREALHRVGQPVDMMSLLSESRREAYNVIEAHGDWELHLSAREQCHAS